VRDKEQLLIDRPVEQPLHGADLSVQWQLLFEPRKATEGHGKTC
jgi:hypothetical protein